MILLLEGVNVVGKSTLAAAFSEAAGGLPILKFDVPPPEAYPHFRDRLVGQFKESPHFIIDRCHLSNYAYHGTLGGGVMSAMQVGMIDNLLKQMGAWLFLMLDTPELIAERLMQRLGRNDAAETLTRHQIGDIQNRFVDAFDLSRIEPKGSFTLPQFVTAEGGFTKKFTDLADQMRATIGHQDRYRRQGGMG